MNWAHKEVGLGWIGLVENVSRKWVSTIRKGKINIESEWLVMHQPVVALEMFFRVIVNKLKLYIIFIK